MTITVVNYGGGTNSTALLIELANRGVRPDIIVFADTGDERKRTYDYITLFSDWLASRGMPTMDIVRWIRRDGSFVPISDLCEKTGELPSKAYGLAGCTTKWKQQPVDGFLRKHPTIVSAWGRGETVNRFLGYDADEPRRIARMAEKDPQPSYPEWRSRGNRKFWKWTAPLVEWGMGRDECVASIRAAGLPLPGKSSCFLCPSMRPHEILELGRTEPDSLARALRIEEQAMRNLRTVKGLGRSFSWRSVVDGATNQVCTVEEDCGCFDGEIEL